MPIIWMIVIGLVVGAISKLVMRKRELGGLLILGIGGSMLAGGMQYSQHNPNSIVVLAAGSIVLLLVYGLTAPTRPMSRRPFEATQLDDDDLRKAA